MPRTKTLHYRRPALYSVVALSMCCGVMVHLTDKIVRRLGVVVHSHDAPDKPEGLNADVA